MIKSISIIILTSLTFLVNAQLSKDKHLQFIADNSILTLNSLKDFDQIYFVRFDYCGASKYCGKSKFTDLLDSTPMTKTLFVIDTAFSKNEMPSIMENKTIIYVDRERMMRAGLFSGRTALLRSKKKKVKWLD